MGSLRERPRAADMGLAAASNVTSKGLQLGCAQASTALDALPPRGLVASGAWSLALSDAGACCVQRLNAAVAADVPHGEPIHDEEPAADHAVPQLDFHASRKLVDE